MKRRHVIVLAAMIALVATSARAQEVGPAMPSTPDAIEVTAPPAPIAVRQDDAAAFLRNTPTRSEAPPPASAGTRELTADEPARPVVNQTSRFIFVDETDRPPVRVKSLPERQSAVEAVRQSVRRPGGP